MTKSSPVRERSLITPLLRVPSIPLLILLAVLLCVSSSQIARALPPTVNLSNNPGSSLDPAIAASGSNVFVVWRDDSSGNFDILLKVSNDGGATFGDEIVLDDGGGNSFDPRIAASGSNVYIAWKVSDDSGNSEIFFAASTNNGTSFSESENVSSNAGSSSQPAVAASGSNVFVVWRDDSLSGNSDILVAASTDNGTTFAVTGDGINTGSLGSFEPSVTF